MKKKCIVAALVAVMALLLTGCSVEGIPSFRAMMFGEPEMIELPYNPLDYVTLGQYKDIEVESMVTEDDLRDALDSLMTKGGEEVQIKEGTVKRGNFINFDYSGKIDGKEFQGGTNTKQYLRVGTGKMIDGFEDALIGMKVGEQKDAKMKFPKEYGNKEVAGKEVVFTLKVNYIYKEADDALVAKLTNSQYKTVKDYKESQRKTLDDQNASKYLNTALGKVEDSVKIKEVPKALLENVKSIQSKSLESQAARDNMDVETYLSQYNMTEDSYYEMIGKQRLLCEAVAQEEGYRVTKEKFQEKFDEILKQIGMSEAKYRKNFKAATSENTSLEDFIIYSMKDEFFYDLVKNTMKVKSTMKKK